MTEPAHIIKTDDIAADVILGECNGQAWLVRGEQHIDDLLGNTLPVHVSIEVIACESKSAIDAMWRGFGGGADDMDMMWMIHPAIANRARGQARLQGRGQPPGDVADMTVGFAAWSAALDDAAMESLRTMAEAALQRPDARLVLLRHVAADGPAMAAEMANLRTGLIEAQLGALGVAAGQIMRETGPTLQSGDTDRIVLSVRDA